MFMAMALSSTAVLAQTAADPAIQSPAATPAAPIAAPAADVTAPQDVTNPAPAPAMTLAPLAPAASPAPATAQDTVITSAPTATPQASATVASGPVIGTPVVHMPDTDATAEPAATPARVKRTSTATARSTPAPVATKTAAAPAPAPIERTEAPAAAAPIAAPAPASVARKTEVTQVRSTDDTSLELIGLGGAGLVVLGGAAFAFSRRKRRYELEDDVLLNEPAMADPIAAPAYVAPAYAQAVAMPAATAQPTMLPNGFDLSRFGRHTRAAYVGPTPENPSLSLRRRLKHASFFDGRERMAGIAPEAAMAPVAQTADASREQVVFRPAARTAPRPKVSFRPAYQS
jgi:hypothetical protein